MRPEAKEWFKSALEELKVAEILFRNKLYSHSSFHAHQAVEKALKALWIEIKGEIPPKTHSLVFLCRELGLELDEHKLKKLSTVYYASRYPDTKEEISAEKAMDFIIISEEIVEKVKRVVAWG